MTVNTDKANREDLGLLQQNQAESKLKTLRQLIDEGENSGTPIDWDVNDFLKRMKARKS